MGLRVLHIGFQGNMLTFYDKLKAWWTYKVAPYSRLAGSDTVFASQNSTLFPFVHFRALVKMSALYRE
jgi:hypothetical protein